MPSKSLPERPSLAQLKLQAKELQQLHKNRRQSAAARIVANHPRFKARAIEDVLETPFKVADAQLVVDFRGVTRGITAENLVRL